ncbi:MAG TPA: hypothetical protein VGE56_01795 [Rhodocyclaceae bacterium]
MKLRPSVVSADYVQGSFDLLPGAHDRARAALYFSVLIGSKSFEGDMESSRWHLRAALSEFRSIFDLLNGDLKTLGLHTQWDRSTYKQQMESDSIVAVLRKVRDFAIHSKTIVGSAKTFGISSLDSGAASGDMPGIVIEPVDRKAFALAGGKDELSKFDDDTLREFNEQASCWPADMLIHIAVYRTSEYLSAFLNANGKVGV